MHLVSEQILVELEDEKIYTIDGKIADKFKTINNFKDDFPNSIIPLPIINNDEMKDISMLSDGVYHYTEIENLVKIIDTCLYLDADNMIYDIILFELCKCLNVNFGPGYLLKIIENYTMININCKNEIIENIIKISTHNEINYLNTNNENLLMLRQIYKLDINIYQQLTCKININFKNNDGCNSLMIACMNNQIQHVKLLINRQANLDAQNNNGDTPLMIAIKQNNIEITDILIQSGANINNTNNQKQTPLIIALQKNTLDIFEMLLKSGVNTEILNSDGYTILMEAAMQCNSSVVACLIKNKTNLDTKKKITGRTALMCVSVHNVMIEIVNLLVAGGANLNITDNDGHTALMIACQYSDTEEIVRFLIEHGSSVDVVDNNGNSPLMLALSDINNFKLLINNHPNLNIQNKKGETVLMMAADSHKYHEQLKILIAAGADLNIKDFNNHSAIRRCIQYSNKNSDLLIESGAYLDFLSN